MTTDRSQRRIFLGMPGYGDVTAGASRGFWRASQHQNSVHWQYQCGSLLAQNFNILWATALNMAKDGKPVDYFAMQHADIEPEDGWLDMLIDELEANDLDVLGVAVPIKDTKGMTSLALAREDGDTWRPKCRLTMREVYRLPETFTSEHVGAPLLLNTGLWVCRFDPSWTNKVHFEINDRIVIDEATGQYRVQNEPEDWFFSRLLHEQGLKIGATRTIRLTHRGSMSFQNMEPYGEPFDSAYVSESTLPKPPAWFPVDVDGWLTETEGTALRELAAGKEVLEIGAYCGRSTICMATDAKHVTTLDYCDGRATGKPQDTYEALVANLDKYQVADRVSVRHPSVVLTQGGYDFAFIDGAHDYESVKADIAKVLPAMKSGALIAFHDYSMRFGQYGSDGNPGVSKAVDELLEAGGELLSTHDTLAVVRPPANIPLEV